MKDRLVYILKPYCEKNTDKVADTIVKFIEVCPECSGEGNWESSFEKSGVYNCTFCKGKGIVAKGEKDG